MLVNLWDTEKLNRGLVAMKTDSGIFLSWRLWASEDPLFGTAEDVPVFTLLRDGRAIATLSGKTCFTDAEGTAGSVYEVAGPDGAKSAPVRALESGANWFDIPLERPEESPYGPYTIGDVSCGDLDGDGDYELVVKWDSAPRDNAEDGFSGNVLLDAYKMDGTRLWEKPVDLGVNIRAGAHYTQFLVYDLDGDGKSELICKTAPGSRDAAGHFVSQASRERYIRRTDDTADLRSPSGHVTAGDEFLTVFRGANGRAADTIWYPNQRIDVKVWGDDQGNRSERYTAVIARLDGRRPYAVFLRGYYRGRKDPHAGRQCACAVSFDGACLRCRYSFDTYDERRYADRRHSDSYLPGGRYKGVRGYAPGHWRYVGEGNHNAVAADVDGDGRDEVLTGALCYHVRWGRLGVKWCTFLGHGDAMHLRAEHSRKGFVLLTVHEEHGTDPVTGRMRDGGLSLLDAATGFVRFHRGVPGDTGRGMLADVGAGGEYQFWGTAEVGEEKKWLLVTPSRKTEAGFEPADIPGRSANFRLFWDGDVYEELLDGPAGGPLSVTSWNGERMEEIFRTEGCVSINGTKANPCLQADLFGDWREELVMAREDQQALRVYTTDIPTDYAVKTLMHDPVYRASVAAEQTAYNQPPSIGFDLKAAAGRTDR